MTSDFGTFRWRAQRVSRAARFLSSFTVIVGMVIPSDGPTKPVANSQSVSSAIGQRARVGPIAGLRPAPDPFAKPVWSSVAPDEFAVQTLSSGEDRVSFAKRFGGAAERRVEGRVTVVQEESRGGVVRRRTREAAGGSTRMWDAASR